jgi:hypothetical protein
MSRKRIAVPANSPGENLAKYPNPRPNDRRD